MNKFRHDMDDDEWLSMVGEKGWVVFSHDRKFHTLAVEATAVHQFSIGCFYLYGANSPTWNKLVYFMKVYPNVMKIIGEQAKPYIYDIDAGGRFCKVDIQK